MDEADARGVAGRKRVVIVEDDAEIRELETFLLTAEGYQVIGAENGAEGLAAIRRESADLVLLDLMLPDTNGNEVLAEIARDPKTSRVPVVVVSAFVRSLAATPQVKRVLWKPFDLADLLDAVAHELEHGPAN